MSLFEEFIGEREEDKVIDVKLPSFSKPFKVRKLTAFEQNNIMRKYSRATKTGEINDPYGMALDLVTKCVIYPDLTLTETMQDAEKIYEVRTGETISITTPSSALVAMTTPDEYDLLINAVKNSIEERKQKYLEDKEFR